MKKVALVFVLAVLGPSLVLAWLAVRSLRDQQFLLERQQSLLCQGVADHAANNVQEMLAEYQRAFEANVTALLRTGSPTDIAKTFHETLRAKWPLAQVGFVVTLRGDFLCPAPYESAEANKFLTENSRFLGNRESAEVYLNPKTVANNLFANSQNAVQVQKEFNNDLKQQFNTYKNRAVIPQQQLMQKPPAQEELQQQASKLASSEAEFRQLVAEDNDGVIARFVDNKLNVLFWYRAPRDPQIIFGALLSLPRLQTALTPVVVQAEPELKQDICVALLDDTARPIALSHPEFKANWKRPFVATEIGETLPHWEVAVYLLNPAKLQQAAHNVRLTLGLLITVLVLAIGVGGWLIFSDLNRQLTLARQKTDFVSNVSHELKTPLTSIRMFSELLADGRVSDTAKQRSYLSIITAEAARLTRLINNVLDFARMERGEKKYSFAPCDLTSLARDTFDSYKPNLEAGGFRLACELPQEPLFVKGDRDALAQVLVNLLSNAEK